MNGFFGLSSWLRVVAFFDGGLGGPTIGKAGSSRQKKGARNDKDKKTQRGWGNLATRSIKILVVVQFGSRDTPVEQEILHSA